MGLLSFSADDLLKLPFVKTVTTIITVILCICPGIFIMYLHDSASFNDMNIFKLLLISMSANILCYVGILSLVFSLIVVKQAPLLKTGVIPEDKIERIQDVLEKAIITTNLGILMAVATTVTAASFKDAGPTYREVIKSFKLSGFAFLFSWFIPDITINYISIFLRKKEIAAESKSLPNPPESQ